MIVECLSDGGVRLSEPFDFLRFKLMLKGNASSDTASIRRITFVDADNALVPIDLVPTLPGRPADKTWDDRYAEMIAKARDHGWIDVNANAIRAHVEREF